MARLITSLGDYEQSELGLILPHEHIFVDLAAHEGDAWRTATAADVIALMAPELERARASGVTALVECTPTGVGRRADIVSAVSRAAGLPVVLPTGVYREPWVPAWVHEASVDALRDWMIGELAGEIDDTGVQAAWIKISAGDDGMTAVERKILRAAAQAGAATGAVIGSHTMRGRVVLDQLDVVEAENYVASRFIWIHTQLEADPALALEAGARGAWLEYDAIGSDYCDDAYFLEHIPRLLAAGLGDQLLLSQDRGWYDPRLPGGGAPLPYTYLVEQFLPQLRAAGVDAATISRLTRDNPFRAFARPE
jgi:phosphotriesterase-related protein